MTLLDSNVLIHYLRGTEPLFSRLRAASPAKMAIPSIVAYELEYGTLKSTNPRRRAMLQDIVGELEEIPFDAAAARAAARIRVDLEKIGAVIGPLDLLIAGIAESRGAVLVTANLREFSRVPGLRVEDWSR